MKPYIQLNNMKKGFALSIVLWIVAALLMGVSMLSFFAKDTVSLTTNLNDKLYTKLHANDTLEVLKYYIKTADYDSVSFINEKFKNEELSFPSILYVDNRWHKIDRYTKIKVLDTSALVNIVTYPANMISFLAVKGENNSFFYTVRDALKDWRDNDSFLNLSGAESDTYRLKKEKSFFPRNSNAIQDPTELRLVNGIDALSTQDWHNLKKQLYFGRTGLINLLLTDKIILSYLLKIKLQDAEDLIKVRETDYKKFFDLVRMHPNFNSDNMKLYISKQLKISILVEKNGAKTMIEAMIDFRQNRQKTYTTLYYKEY